MNKQTNEWMNKWAIRLLNTDDDDDWDDKSSILYRMIHLQVSYLIETNFTISTHFEDPKVYLEKHPSKSIGTIYELCLDLDQYS